MQPVTPSNFGHSTQASSARPRPRGSEPRAIRSQIEPDAAAYSSGGELSTVEELRAAAGLYGPESGAGVAPLAQLSPEEAGIYRAAMKAGMHESLRRLRDKVEELGAWVGDADEQASEVDSAEVDALDARMPEAWRADATAQRIADFAASFATQYAGEGFQAFAVDSIQQGYEEAMEELGGVGGAVAGLMERTLDMAIQKLEEMKLGGAPRESEMGAESADGISA